ASPRPRRPRNGRVRGGNGAAPRPPRTKGPTRAESPTRIAPGRAGHDSPWPTPPWHATSYDPSGTRQTNGLRPSHHRAALAAVLGRAGDVRRGAATWPPEDLRARHVPVSVRFGPARRASG